LRGASFWTKVAREMTSPEATAADEDGRRLAYELQGLSHRGDRERETRSRAAFVRAGGIEAAFAKFRGLSWPWKFVVGAALGLPSVAYRLAAFGFTPELPYLVFYPAVAMAAAAGGAVAGLGAALVSVLAGTLWAAPALTADFLLRLGTFLLYAAVICMLAEAMHRTLWRLGEASGQRADADKLLVANERFRLASADRIGTFDLDIVNNVATHTDAMRAIFGLSKDGVINPERVISLALPQDRSKIRAALAAACDPAGDGVYQAEYRILRENDGAVRWIAERGQVYFEFGRAKRMIVVCHDLTDLRTAELAMRNSESQIRRFVEQAPIEIAMLDRNMNYVAASRRWLANYGRGLSTLVGVSHYTLHPDIPDRWKAIHRLVEAGEFHSDDDDVWVDADGRTHWLRWAAYPWTDWAGAIGGIIISAEDIAGQKQAERALRESEEKFRNAFAQAAIGFVMAKAGGKIVEANAAYCRLTGFGSEELKSMRIIDCVHPEDRADVAGLAAQIGRGDIPAFVIEHRGLRKDGSTIWLRESVSMTHDAAGDPQWLVSLVEDVTARKRIEDTVARTVAQLTAVLDGAKDGIIAIDVNGAVRSINAAAERMFGYERNEVVGRNLRMLMPQADAEHHDRYIANYLETGIGKVIGIGREAEGRRKDGTQFPVDLAIVEAAVEDDLIFVGFVRDLSERRLIDSRIDQLAAQRLTAIGGMAGAMAHEINQPLAAIGVYLETARRMLVKSQDQQLASVEVPITRALAQVERMGDIIGHLRDFVGHGEADKTYRSLHALIRSVVSEAISDGRKGCAALALELNAEHDEVVMDPVQIGQVLSNLVRNAREAVGEAPGGRIVISTAPEGDEAIRCEVSDNGPGLADAVMDSLFEPFNSTKATGMGVGLSISKSIVEAHYGRIWARPNPLGGAVFSFTLPLATGESDE
jgi:PAS domain S-box-containing protein